MKKIKELIAISFLFVITGCEDKANLTKPSDNKSYFVCIDKYDPIIESVLYIDHNKKIIKDAGKEWKNYSQDEQKIDGKIQGDGYDNTIQFNFVTGRLNITMSNYFPKGMAVKNGVTNYYYQCRKTESML